MQKATLPDNALLQSKQRFLVEGLPEADRIVTRDAITLEYEEIERPDGTKISGGRVTPGEFNITLDFADNETRRAYYGWWNQSKDAGGKSTSASQQIDFQNPRAATIPGVGNSKLVTGHYKRRVTNIFHRHQQLRGVENQPVIMTLIGCWVKSCEVPDFDIAGTETLMLTFTICYDDGQIEENG